MTGTKRAAIYCRISDDRSGQEAGVTRQREECLAYVEGEGWVLVADGLADTFTDNDISAFSGRTRPAYDRMVEAVTGGEVDVIVTWHNDRLHRRPVELESLITLVETTKVSVATVKAGSFDLSARSGITSARLAVTIANDASMATRERVQSAMNSRAREGRVHGMLRTYGYAGERHGDGSHTFEVVEPEAGVIREAAKRVLAGETVLAVVRDFNAREVPTLRGKRWSRNVLRGILISARVCGWREHTPGRKAGGAGKGSGQWRGGEFTAAGNWPAILSRRDVERLRRVLNDESGVRGPAHKYLLSGGLARCGLCGAALRGRPNRYGSRDYACAGLSSNGLGCGKVSVRAEALEDLVVHEVSGAVGSGEIVQRLRARLGDADEAADLVASLEADLAGLGADFGSGAITRGEWMAARGPLMSRWEKARRVLARQAGAEVAALASGTAEQWQSRWREAPTVEAQRGMIRALLATVTVAPAVRGRNRFDSARVALEWQE